MIYGQYSVFYNPLEQFYLCISLNYVCSDIPVYHKRGTCSLMLSRSNVKRPAGRSPHKLHVHKSTILGLKKDSMVDFQNSLWGYRSSNQNQNQNHTCGVLRLSSCHAQLSLYFLYSPLTNLRKHARLFGSHWINCYGRKNLGCITGISGLVDFCSMPRPTDFMAGWLVFPFLTGLKH